MSDLGHRPVNAWGAGELPAPYAIGDTIRVPEGAATLERLHGMGPGRYRVIGAYSIDEGDAWYFRLARRFRGYVECPDRLHVAFADRCSSMWSADTDWLAGCELTKTSDPAGLARRSELLAAEWFPPTEDARCPTCGGRRP